MHHTISSTYLNQQKVVDEPINSHTSNANWCNVTANAQLVWEYFHAVQVHLTYVLTLGPRISNVQQYARIIRANIQI